MNLKTKDLSVNEESPKLEFKKCKMDFGANTFDEKFSFNKNNLIEVYQAEYNGYIFTISKRKYCKICTLSINNDYYHSVGDIEKAIKRANIIAEGIQQIYLSIDTQVNSYLEGV